MSSKQTSFAIRVLVTLVGSIMCLLGATPQGASPSKYTIRFIEGAYEYNTAMAPADERNKYLAKVTVEKDGVVIATVRGSTLPDAYFFYRGWHAGGRAYPPTDDDVRDLVSKVREGAEALRAESGDGLDSLRKIVADISELQAAIEGVPVLWSGTYIFKMGRHRETNCYTQTGERRAQVNGKYCAHGHPYVPRLLGMPGAGYDGRVSPTNRAPSLLTVGGRIMTINPNMAQSYANVADGINIHDGRRQDSYKDSEGCLTIAPSDWQTFYGALPSPAQWREANHTGEVVIARPGARSSDGAPVPSAPTNLRIVKG